ncbi:methyltransferase [Stappia sp. 22II-S9-Z10]|nr:methyltransferase [Stappia sp. 22II-S9-Z10]
MSIDEEALGEAYDAARAAEDSGDIETAVQHFLRCLEIDPDDHCGVVMRLARYGRATPKAAPPSYVATLFGQHAEEFDDILVGDLGYDVPAIARRLAGPYVNPPARMLDLGCGTGLAGVAFKDVAIGIVGVDLAEEMLDMTDERGVYQDLYVGEAVNFLAEWDESPFDLIVATDVWPYLGDLKPFAAAARPCLTPGGLLVASTERAESGWRVTDTQRFAHALAYIADTFGAAGLTLVASEPVTVRMEEGEPVPGDVFVLRRD